MVGHPPTHRPACGRGAILGKTIAKILVVAGVSHIYISVEVGNVAEVGRKLLAARGGTAMRVGCIRFCS